MKGKMNIILMTFVVLSISFLPSCQLAGGQGSKTTSFSEKKQYVNHVGMTFRLIPAGTFIMGSPENEPGRDIDENQHPVTISKPFYMQITEVTQKQWIEVMGNNPSYFTACGLDCPVERVSWDMVQDFLRKLNSQSDKTYRLPTEAEFEYAARAGSTTVFANGHMVTRDCDRDPVLDSMGWYCYNSNESTHAVAAKTPNAWGLYDMHGNVWEWCQDLWDGSKYPDTHVVDPVGETPSNFRVIRGGSWQNDAWYARSANRDYWKPYFGNDYVGFRLVLNP